MSTQAEATAAVQKTVTVKRPIEDAFQVFTERIGSWWPTKQYSLGQEKVKTVLFETKAGGRIYEIQEDGTEADWAEVLEWDPPRRFVLAWNPIENPDARPATEVEVRFTSEGEGTRVDVTHRGWERLGGGAAGARRGYDSGWDEVLGEYVAEAKR